MSDEIVEAQLTDSLQVGKRERSLLQIANEAEKMIDAVKKIKEVALKLTNADDWVDENDKPYLQASGSEKVAGPFGISWAFLNDPIPEVEDDGHFTYCYKGRFSMGGRTIDVDGSRSSKDPFFKKYSWNNNVKTELPISAIDKRDVKMAAMTNLLGNGITRILGIRNLTWEDLDKFAKIKKEQVRGFKYGKGGNKAEIKEPQKKTNGQTTKQETEKNVGPFVLTPISEVKVTHGKKGDGTPWSNYRVYGLLDGNETAFSTFSETVGKLAQEEKGTGTVLRLDYEKVIKGDKTYINILELCRVEEDPGPEDDNAQA